MIVTLSELLVAVVVIPFAWILLDWLLETLAGRRDARQLRSAVQRCHLCGREYRAEGKGRISTCPACLARNDRKGPRKLG